MFKNFLRKSSQQIATEQFQREMKKNAQSCNEMPYEEWLEHSECTENYKDLDDLPLESLKYRSDKNIRCGEMSLDEWSKDVECMGGTL